MDHRWLCTHRVLHRPLLFCPLNHNALLRSVVTQNSTLTAPSEGTRQPRNSEPHLSVMKDLRSHSSLRSKWDNVILNSEMKLQLISDIEGFFDRKEDYKSFVRQRAYWS